MEKENISISSELLVRIKEQVTKNRFDTVEDYVEYVLNKVLAKVEDQVYDEEDEKKVKDRLRVLGYLD